MIPSTILIAAEPFGGSLDAAKVAAALGRGLQADAPTLGVDPVVHELPADFDTRLHLARALLLAPAALDRHTLLARGPTFELATRARQGGVPCYAVTAHSALDSFEARILDLQVVLQAPDARALRAAGRKLAGIV